MMLSRPVVALCLALVVSATACASSGSDAGFTGSVFRSIFDADLSAREQTLLDHVRRVGALRRATPTLRRGRRTTLLVTPDLYVYARGAGPGMAIVASNRSAVPAAVSVPVPIELGLRPGTVPDALGGAGAVASATAITISLPARGSAIYVTELP